MTAAWNPGSAAGLALPFLAAAIALSALVATLPTPVPGEAALARAVQDLPGWLEPFFRAVRAATTSEVTTPVSIVLAVVGAVAGRRRFGVAILVALALLVATQSGIKDLLDRPRPTEAQVEVRDGWSSPSYPAGHAMGGSFAVVAAALLAEGSLRPRQRRRVPAVATGSVVIVAVANVYMGVHWPTDALGGALFGSGLALTARALAGDAAKRRTR